MVREEREVRICWCVAMIFVSTNSVTNSNSSYGILKNHILIGMMQSVTLSRTKGITAGRPRPLVSLSIFASCLLAGWLHLTANAQPETSIGWSQQSSSSSSSFHSMESGRLRVGRKASGGHKREKLMVECLAAHNKFRRLHGAPELQWDDKVSRLKSFRHFASSNLHP